MSAAALSMAALVADVEAISLRLLEAARVSPKVVPNGQLAPAMAQLVEAQAKLRQERPPKKRKAKR